jgi:hypothetical protein
MMYFTVVMMMSVHTISDSEPRTASDAGCLPRGTKHDLEGIEQPCANIAIHYAKGGQTQRSTAVLEWCDEGLFVSSTA